MRYWIYSAPLDVVKAGKEGGFVQVDSNIYSLLRKIDKGDVVLFYSPIEKEGGVNLQEFTAVGQITDSEPYEVDTGLMSYQPWQRSATYFESKTAPIRPLIKMLEFIADPFRWGLEFRKGLFEIEGSDFKRIAKAMKADLSGLDKS